MLQANDTIRIVKGCRARELPGGATCRVIAVVPLGAEYSHSVKVLLRVDSQWYSSRLISFYARHPNRLNDAVINLNDGNPLHKIQIVKLSSGTEAK
jgi:hypothetical protein